MKRPEFRQWVDKQPDPGWTLMPLTHLTKALTAGDIIRDGQISLSDKDSSEPSAYFFYGRPAYKVHGDGPLKFEAACPFCFIFDPEIIKQSKAIHAFDSGAFADRMYKHILMDEMTIDDFSLEKDSTRPNKLISAVFSSRLNYFEGNVGPSIPTQDAAPWEFLPAAYLELLRSRGRNEPDDRICSIEVVFGSVVPLQGNLRAVIVPHTLWTGNQKSPWLTQLHGSNVEVIPYQFTPGKHPAHYHALLESEVREFYRRGQWL